MTTQSSPSLEEQRKIKVVYGGVTFQKKLGDLTLSKPGISFTAYGSGGCGDAANDHVPHIAARFRWNAIQKHFVNKSKPMIKIKILDPKTGEEQGLTFTMTNRDELEALREHLVARLPPLTERLSMVLFSTEAEAPSSVPPEERQELPKASVQEGEDDSSLMETYTMTKSSDIPPPVVEIEEEMEVDVDSVNYRYNNNNNNNNPVRSQERAIVQAQQRNDNNNVAVSSSDMTICTTTTAAYDDVVNMNGDIHGTSRYLSPVTGAQLIAEAEFEDFAPQPCICLKCFVHESERKRTYIRVYENRIESNIPHNPCWCLPPPLTDERCIVDNPRIRFFDKSPHRVGMHCNNLIPCVCCGPPVIYSKVPRACCGLVDLRSCYGEQIMASGCDCFHVRCCLCLGPFCFQTWACPVYHSIQNGPEFLQKWNRALTDYHDKHNIDETQRARFYHIEDQCCATDSCKPIEASQVMER